MKTHLSECLEKLGIVVSCVFLAIKIIEKKELEMWARICRKNPSHTQLGRDWREMIHVY